MEFRDGLGRVAERHLYEEPDTFKARTAYSYDALGRLTGTIQGEAINTLNPATHIAHTYDTLGRKTRVVDPDSGEWNYHYDAVGNLRVQDDPKSGQHIQFCYDNEDRMTRSCQVNGDFTGTLLSCSGACPGERITYAYYTTAATGQDRLGRLSSVTDASGSSSFEQYDLRGRLLRDTKVVAPGGGFATTSATTQYAYDAADHLTSLTYPDGEVVHYFYDGTGQLRRVRSATHQVDYLADLTYDHFGRPRVITHGNGTADTRAYHDKTKNYRLASIDTKRGADKWLDFRYTAYSPQGLLTQLTDSGPKGAGNDMDNSAAFTYDGLGRLTRLSMPKLGIPFTYAYDYLGNMIEKEQRLFSYSPTRPHTLVSIGSASFTHDRNGNRESNGGHTPTTTITAIASSPSILPATPSSSATTTADGGSRRSSMGPPLLSTTATSWRRPEAG